MQKWKYVVTRDAGELAALGARGWELVSVCADNGALVHYLKRPAPTLAERVTLEQRAAELAGRNREGGEPQ